MHGAWIAVAALTGTAVTFAASARDGTVVALALLLVGAAFAFAAANEEHRLAKLLAGAGWGAVLALLPAAAAGGLVAVSATTGLGLIIFWSVWAAGTMAGTVAGALG